MRAASILLALVVVLGFVAEAGAYSLLDRYYPDHTISIGNQRFGFADHRHGDDLNFSCAYLGPLGQHRVPFTATQGLIGFIVILAVLIVLLLLAYTLHRNRRAPQMPSTDNIASRIAEGSGTTVA